MQKLGQNKLWVLKSKGSSSAFGGNTGYDDELESHYVFNNNVMNHNRINENDFVVLVDKTNILGIGKIDSINVKKDVSKIRYRCPVCNTQEHYPRKNVLPRYKCRNKHIFDNPVEEQITVEEYTAHYGQNFHKFTKQTSVKLLDEYYIKRNLYYSIQSANPTFLKQFDLSSILATTSNHLNLLSKWKAPYNPTNEDTRKQILQKQKQRKGQQSFRSDLIEIYGSYCMLTGVKITETIEASHICPYRGENDNHPANGLLLRKDLHALFDSDLLGFDPADMTTKLSPRLKGTLYEEFEMKKLLIDSTNNFSPSIEALKIRWEIFSAQILLSSQIPNI